MSYKKSEFPHPKKLEQICSLQTLAQTYFYEFYGNKIEKIKFFNKDGGVQLGQRMRIIYNDDNQQKQTITYYIKTFSNGTFSLEERDDDVMYNIPDLKELFMYKVLEYSGFGPKCHFLVSIENDKKEFYVATQSVSFTKDRKKSKRFILFNDIEDSYSLDSEVKRAEATVCLDLLAKIFKIDDLHDKNFGQAIVNNSKEKWFLIDFLVKESKEYGYKYGETSQQNQNNFFKRLFFNDNEGTSISELKWDGTKMPCYAQFLEKSNLSKGSGELIEYINKAKIVFKEGKEKSTSEKKMSLDQAINKAYKEILDFMKENGCTISEEDLNDFKVYKEDVLDNFNALQNQNLEVLKTNNVSSNTRYLQL